MWELTRWYSRGNQKTNATISLFEDEDNSLPVPKAENYDNQTQLEHECETLGFLISQHPLMMYLNNLKNINYVRAMHLHRYVGKTITTIGWLVTRKATRTKNDEMMEFISFEDTTAIYETVFFPKTYNQFCYMMTHSKPYILRGKVEEEFGAVTLTVDRVEFL